MSARSTQINEQIAKLRDEAFELIEKHFETVQSTARGHSHSWRKDMQRMVTKLLLTTKLSKGKILKRLKKDLITNWEGQTTSDEIRKIEKIAARDLLDCVKSLTLKLLRILKENPSEVTGRQTPDEAVATSYRIFRYEDLGSSLEALCKHLRRRAADFKSISYPDVCRSARATNQVTSNSSSTTKVNLQRSATGVPKKRARVPGPVIDPSVDSKDMPVGTIVRVGRSFWTGEVISGPVEWGSITHYQVAITYVDTLKGWFPKTDLYVLGVVDPFVRVFDSIFHDSDDDNGEDWDGYDNHQPPSNGSNYPSQNNGASPPGANDFDESFNSNCSSRFSLSLSNSSFLPPAASLLSPRISDSGMLTSTQEELPSVRSDRHEEIVSDDEDAVASDEEKGASDGEQEGDWEQLTNLYTHLFTFVVRGKHPSVWQSAVESDAAAPTELSSSRNDCQRVSAKEEDALSAQLQTLQIGTPTTNTEEAATNRKQALKTAIDFASGSETPDADAPEVEIAKRQISQQKPAPRIKRIDATTTTTTTTTKGKKNVQVGTAVDTTLTDKSGDAELDTSMGELVSAAVTRRGRMSRRKPGTPVKCVVGLANDILASGSGNDISLWNLATKELVGELKGHTGSVRCLAVLADNVLASGSDDKSIRLWNMSTHKMIHELKGHSGGVYSLEVLPNNVLASGGYDTSIRLWNVSTREIIRELKGHPGSVHCLAALANNVLASSSWDKSIRLWNVSTGEVIRELKGHRSSVQCLAALSDNVLASGGSGQYIRLWNVSTGKMICRWKGHTSCVSSLVALSDNVLASGGGDKNIRLWNVSRRKIIRELEGNAQRVYSLAALDDHEDFQALASGCNQGAVRLWNTTTGEMVSALGHEPTEADCSRRDDRDRNTDDVVVTASDRIQDNVQRALRPGPKAKDRLQRSKSEGFLGKLSKVILRRWSQIYEKDK